MTSITTNMSQFQHIQSLEKSDVNIYEDFENVNRFNVNMDVNVNRSSNVNNFEKGSRNHDVNSQHRDDKPQINLCEKGSDKFKVCGGCRSVYYCSQVCQSKGWKYHQRICKSIQKLQNERKISIYKKGVYNTNFLPQ